MKKILLTGRIDESMTAFSKRLSSQYSVHFGSSVPLVVFGILESFKPDLVVSRLSDTDKSVIARIASDYSGTPLIAVGTQAEAEAVRLSGAKALCGSMDEAFDAVNGIFSASGDDLSEKRRMIMVVDDDAAMLRMIKIMLEDEYDIVLAPSGEKAFKLFERGIPDMILLDYEMPDMNGVEMLEKLHGDERYDKIPVIFLTGMTDPSIFDVIRTSGVSGHLVKPVDAVNIKAAIKSVFEK